MKLVTLCSTVILALTFPSSARAQASGAELAFRDAARPIVKTAKAELATHARGLNDGLRGILQLAETTGDLGGAVDTSYDLVLDYYAAAHGSGRKALAGLRDAGLDILADADLPDEPRDFQDGANGLWDVHERQTVKLLGTTFARMEKLQHAFAASLARIAQKQDSTVVLNVKHAVPDVPSIVGPAGGLGVRPADPGTKLRVLTFWTARGSAMGPAGMGGGVAEAGAGPVRVTLRGPDGYAIDQLAAVEPSGRFEFWFGLPAAPGAYTVEASYESGRPGGDALASFVTGP